MTRTLILSLALCLLAPAQAANYSTDDVTGETSRELVHASLNKVEQAARNAAVRVERPFADGYGSGSYFKCGKTHFVVTAQHVVDSSTFVWVLSPSGERVRGEVVYASSVPDIAVIRIEEMTTRKPMRYRPADQPIDAGTEVTYSGYPGGHLDTLTFDGSAVGYERGYLLVNSFIWFGSSGSCFFDKHGRLVGIVSAIEVKEFVTPQALPGLAYVAVITPEVAEAIDDALQDKEDQ